jgi:EAL and modified HD-GYP domain-containing signal transduction protein
MENIYIGRQSILDPDLKIYGYEIFFRDKKFEYNPHLSSVSIEETARVIMNILTYIDFKDIIGNKKGFIRVSPEILEGEFLDILPPEQTVFQISGITSVTKYLISSCDDLRDKGYEIAACVGKDYEKALPLFDSVDYIKVNIADFEDDKELKNTADTLKEFLNAKLIAYRVETEKDFLLTKELGFDLFQGHFFEKPAFYKGEFPGSSKIALINLLKMAIKEEEFSKIEEFFKANPDLSYSLLKYVNSPFFYLRQKISSIKQALSILGYRNLQKWIILQIFALGGVEVKHNPILERAIIRGKMMEIITKKITNDFELFDKSYLVGMLSLIGVAIGKTSKEVLDEINVSDDIKEAILEYKGILGKILKSIISLEHENIDEAKKLIEEVGLSLEDLLKAEIDAITYYENFMSNL